MLHKLAAFSTLVSMLQASLQSQAQSTGSARRNTASGQWAAIAARLRLEEPDEKCFH